MGRNNDCTTGNLLDYEYFSKHCRLIGIDLSRQIELEIPDLKQQINFIGRLDRDDGVKMFTIRRNNYWIFTKWCNHSDTNGTSIKFETKNIKSNLCDYSDAYIYVRSDITATVGDANTDVVFKNCDYLQNA